MLNNVTYFMKNSYSKDYFENSSCSNYPVNYSSLINRFGMEMKFTEALKLIKKFKKDGNLLDMGCAYGYFVNLASKNGFDACGMDISNYAIKKSRKIFPKLKFVHFNIEKKTHFRNGCFDVVTAFDVLEHCKDIKRPLNEIKRIVKKDGVILVCVPITEFYPKEDDKDATHHWHLSLNEWKKLLLDNNFEILKTIFYPKLLTKIFPKICTVFILLKPK